MFINSSDRFKKVQIKHLKKKQRFSRSNKNRKIFLLVSILILLLIIFMLISFFQAIKVITKEKALKKLQKENEILKSGLNIRLKENTKEE